MAKKKPQRWRREANGAYLALYDGSKQEFIELIKELQVMARDGLGDNFSLILNGQTFSFSSPRELFFFGAGLNEGIYAPFVEKLERHLSSINDNIYNLGKLSEISIDDDDSDEDKI